MYMYDNISAKLMKMNEVIKMKLHNCRTKSRREKTLFIFYNSKENDFQMLQFKYTMKIKIIFIIYN